MRLLIITSGFPEGNRVAGVSVPPLIDELRKLGADVKVLTQNCSGSGDRTIEADGGYEVTFFGWSGGERPLVEVLRSPLWGLPLAIGYFLSGFRTGKRLIRRWKPDVIFAEWLIPSGLVALLLAKAAGIPYAARALGSDVLVAGRKPGIKQVVSLVARQAAFLFADGFGLAEETGRLAGGKPCHFAPTARIFAERRGTYRPPARNGGFSLCMVGRLHPVKGQDVLIEAAAILAEKGTGVRCHIVGDGEMMQEYGDSIRRMNLQDSVKLTGRLEDGDIAALFNAVDCVAIPSRSESIPLVLKEAVAAGKPLITSDAGDMKYMVETYGLGLVVPKGDPGALAEAIEHMAADTDRGRYTARRQDVTDLLSTELAARTIYTHLVGDAAGGKNEQKGDV